MDFYSHVEVVVCDLSHGAIPEGFGAAPGGPSWGSVLSVWPFPQQWGEIVLNHVSVYFYHLLHKKIVELGMWLISDRSL